MPPPDATAPSLPRASLAAAITVTAIAAALRFWQAGESLWLDELHTAWCAVASLAEVAPRAASGNQSPLFFWLEWLLVSVFGESELILRLPSLIAGSLLPLALFIVAWRWTRSPIVALTAAALAAIDHNAIFYATEARPYALVQLLVVLHVALTAELAANSSRWVRFTWIALAAILFHLHYTAALLIPAELAFLVGTFLVAPTTSKHIPPILLIDTAVLAALCLPAITNLQTIFARRENWAAFIQPAPLWKIAEWFPWSLSVPFILVTLIAQRKHCRPALLTLAWLLVPATIAWLATITDVARIFFPRYLAASAPAAILLAAFCPYFVPWRWAKAGISVLLVAAGLYASGIVPQFQHDGRIIGDRQEDWRGAVTWLNNQLPQHRYPILVASGLIEADALRQPHDAQLEDYCLFPVTGIYNLQAERSDLIPLPFHQPHQLAPELRQLVAHRGGGWLIIRGSPQYAKRLAAGIQGSEFGVQGSGRGQQSEVRGQKSVIAASQSFGNVQLLLLLTTDH